MMIKLRTDWICFVQLEAYHRELLFIVERQAKPQPSFDEKEPLEKRLKALKEELDSAIKSLF
ncbi:hypothetical protein FRX31_009829 [Thalictrum thalictroides]|uniref:Uncharacterized protein n=1 Tax=Thalictrum thalictroides TaxID=46969 RepID=A0A7J6WUL4_THATH|nr:hypothetical protein FRX31_009829 [Thalictrum thalictroides]